MELKDFVEQTIIQITDGVRAGHKYIKDNNFGEGVNDSKYKEINFDVAITSNEEETTGIGGKISVANIFSVGGNDETAKSATNVSRIQFKMYLHISTGNNK